ncbi:hypothetical protein R1flu_015747 [Riccia fluitans]|uniref:Uncharacterized protein n=1 Tax=Riccia fluitans TaxID=41844 RepID=A0ABD1YJV8_9MARC
MHTIQTPDILDYWWHMVLKEPIIEARQVLESSNARDGSQSSNRINPTLRAYSMFAGFFRVKGNTFVKQFWTSTGSLQGKCTLPLERTDQLQIVAAKLTPDGEFSISRIQPPKEIPKRQNCHFWSQSILSIKSVLMLLMLLLCKLSTA